MNSPSPKPAGPGRPKDPEKRQAILAAAKRLFPLHGYEGVSMDAIAAEAGVSKLTVYSHFDDKESLFAAAVRSHCEHMLPPELFLADLSGPIREQLEKIARAFFALVTSPEAIDLHRMMTSPKPPDARLPQLFWEAGPMRVQTALTEFLQTEAAAGQLEIADPRRAATQFFCLLKGEMHARLLCGCADPLAPRDVEGHLAATVDFFLRAYAPRGRA